MICGNAEFRYREGVLLVEFVDDSFADEFEDPLDELEDVEPVSVWMP